MMDVLIIRLIQPKNPNALVLKSLYDLNATSRGACHCSGINTDHSRTDRTRVVKKSQKQQIGNNSELYNWNELIFGDEWKLLHAKAMRSAEKQTKNFPPKKLNFLEHVLLRVKTRLDSLDSARTRSSGGESRLGLDRARLFKTRTRSDSTFSDSTHH